MDMRKRHWEWTLGIALVLALVLVGCGDEETLPSAGPTATALPAERATAAADAAATLAVAVTPHAGEEVLPDARVPLAVGSSAEVAATNPDQFAAGERTGRLRVTIEGILDPAVSSETGTAAMEGHRFWGLRVTLEAVGEQRVNSGVWSLRTEDGRMVERGEGYGVGDDLRYGAIEPGEAVEGVIAFEIPEDAEVAEVVLSAMVDAGGRLVFVRE